MHTSICYMDCLIFFNKYYYFYRLYIYLCRYLTIVCVAIKLNEKYCVKYKHQILQLPELLYVL